MLELIAALKEVAYSMAALHEVVAGKNPDDHRAIAYCACRVAEAYRVIASTYRTMRKDTSP